MLKQGPDFLFKKAVIQGKRSRDNESRLYVHVEANLGLGCLRMVQYKGLFCMLYILCTIFDLITTHTPISAQSSNFIVFRFQSKN